MTPERWQRVKELFVLALERDAQERAAFLDGACADDAGLRRRVEALLASDAQAADFLETPAGAANPLPAADRPPDSLLGRRIGPYEVVAEIGRGGMGAVYRAERADGQFHKPVAIKLVPRGMDSDAIRRRFRHEQQILAGLDHPNIARLIDGGTTDDGLSYFIMDYVDGLPVDGYCDRHGLSVLERLALFRTVCAAVQYAHERQVIHRDLKPGNILVSEDGTVKLLDFGIAKVMTGGTGGWPVAGRLADGVTTTATGLRPMTPRYASPEQVRGAPVTPVSDIYSLGVLLYELVTGHQPYRVEGQTPQAVERAICEADPERPSAVIDRVEEIPGMDGAAALTITLASVSAARGASPTQLRRCLAGDLDNIVLMALRKEPARRYASVAELSEDIGRHLEKQPVRARRDTPLYRITKFLRRNKVAALASALTALLFLSLIGIGYYSLARRLHLAGPPVSPKPLYSMAVLPFKVPDTQSESQYLGLGMADTLITKLNGLQSLVVRSTEDVRKYRKAGVDPPVPGRELGVDVVLDGGIARAGDHLRLSVQLVRVRDGESLWSTSFETPTVDIFKAQDYILEQVTGVLQLKLSDVEKKRLDKRHTTSAEAYELYQKGNALVGQFGMGPAKQAQAYFEAALEKDPNYALAYAGLTSALWSMGTQGYVPHRETLPRRRAAIAKALEIDDTCARAQYFFAESKAFDDWDWSVAERSYRRAIELEPNNQSAHRIYSWYLSALLRHEEAIAEARKCVELAPRSYLTHTALAAALGRARRYDEAIEVYQRARALSPNSSHVNSGLGRAYLHKGRITEAIAEWQEAWQRDPHNFFYLADLGYAYGVAGRTADARQTLLELQALAARQFVSPVAIATVYTGLNDKDQALAWLEKGFKDHPRHLGWLNVDPQWDPLRSDPRFTDLLRRIRLVR